MTPSLRPAEVLRQRLREGAYAEVCDEIRAHGQAASGLEYQKCLADALGQLRDWAAAIEVAKVHLGRAPYFSPMLIAQLSQNARDFDACWDWLAKVRAAEGETLAWFSTACKAATGQGDTVRAVSYGQRVLAEKDRLLGQAVPIVPRAGGTEKVVAFSLFGKDEVYLLGALANARMWRDAAPDWKCWFYLGAGVPKGIADALSRLGGRVGHITNMAVPAYMARFLPLQDPTVARFICRDVDCRPTPREIEILREWEESDTLFHVIRNHPLHTDLVLAGLWGGVPVQGFDLVAEISTCFPKGASNKYGLDQRFLEQRLWARMRASVLTHDEHYRLEGLETRPVGDVALGGGHRDLDAMRRELAGLGIQIEASSRTDR